MVQSVLLKCTENPKVILLNYRSVKVEQIVLKITLVPALICYYIVVKAFSCKNVFVNLLNIFIFSVIYFY